VNNLIIQVAERTGVDAVWPGWGHASENPDLPEALARTPRKIVFLGPHSNAMALLGDKIGSTIIAQAAGVPTVAWSGSEVGRWLSLLGRFDRSDFGVSDGVWRSPAQFWLYNKVSLLMETSNWGLIQSSQV
jgi:hypothetical protein